MRSAYPLSHYEVWHHQRSGEVWAVEVTNGKVEKCCGPVAPQDFTPDLVDYLPYRKGVDAQELDSRRGEFIRDPVTDQAA